jgi:hypothetical protein
MSYPVLFPENIKCLLVHTSSGVAVLTWQPTKPSHDQAIAACGGDMRSTIRALILANEFLEYEPGTQVSCGYMCGVRHGRFKTYSG